MAGVGASGEGCRRGGRGCKGRGPGAARHLHLALRHLPLSQQLAGNLRRRVLGAVDVPRRARADKVVQHDAVPPDELEAAPLNLVDGARRAGEWRRGRCHALPRRRVARRLARGEARPVAQILARRRRPSLVDARKAAPRLGLDLAQLTQLVRLRRDCPRSHGGAAGRERAAADDRGCEDDGPDTRPHRDRKRVGPAGLLGITAPRAWRWKERRRRCCGGRRGQRGRQGRLGRWRGRQRWRRRR